MKARQSSAIVLDSDRIAWLLFQLSLPAFLGMLAMALDNVVGTIFVGRYVGPRGIAALSLIFPVQMLAMGVGQITGIGGSSLISRLLGAGQIGTAKRVLGNSIAFTFLLSITMMVSGLGLLDFWLRLMGASDDVLPHAREYLRIILFGIGFQIFGMALSGLIRAEGNARVPMIGMMVGALLNILLSGYFVGMVKMGVKGAALATLFSQLISFLYLASFYRGKKTVFRLGLRDFRLSLSVLRPVFAIGFASFAMTLANSVSGVLVNHVLGTYGGDYAISAFGIINRIVMFAMMPSMVIGQGVQPIIGFNYGARRFDRAIRAINMAISAATLLSISIFFVLYSAPDTFIGVFTSDEDLLNLASEATRTMFLGLYFMGFVMVGSIVFQALGRARQSLVTSLSRPVFFFIPLVLILPYFFQLKGVWLAFPVSDFLTFLLILSFLIPEINRLRRAAREHQSPSEAR